MSIESRELSAEEVRKILSLEESHFGDLKSLEIAPAKLSKMLSALANAEGGEVYVGVRENKSSREAQWEGFQKQEDANGHIQIIEKLFPLGTDVNVSFLSASGEKGLLLKLEIRKTKQIVYATDGQAYLRRGAQSLPLDEEGIRVLERNKGISTFEDETVSAPIEVLTDSENIKTFMSQVIPETLPLPWLKKNLLISSNLPTVAGVVLFADEPQAVLPKRSGLKIYRYETSDSKGTRETLSFDPVSIDGNGYFQIREAVRRTAEIIESIRIHTSEGMKEVSYPREALHEIITNAVLHRDYSITDDIHIVVFNNRVEIRSPGILPGHVTPANILDERFARNPKIVRLMNKFPEAPNKDVGEGLNTAFEAMRKMRLKDPVVLQDGGYVTVILKHESLASPEERILEYLKNNETITNKIAREICFIGSENAVKRIFQKMVKNEILERIETKSRRNTAYKLKR